MIAGAQAEVYPHPAGAGRLNQRKLIGRPLDEMNLAAVVDRPAALQSLIPEARRRRRPRPGRSQQRRQGQREAGDQEEPARGQG